jgi:pimeloyl-ACP methyl ester carboxylesterase
MPYSVLRRPTTSFAAHRWLALLLGLLAWPASARAVSPLDPILGHLVAHRLHGQLVDYSHYLGRDNRICSEVLHEKRGLYVYLPPGYDPCQQYPIILYLHGFSGDENEFSRYIVKYFDKAIVEGCLPPVIVAAPDGRFPHTLYGGFFLNNKHGCYEDYLLQEIWPFLLAHFPVRPEREAHVLFGQSTGGWSAYSLAIKHRDCFGVVAGLIPMLNPRWLDCHGKYGRNFDPCCWGWREELKGADLLGFYYGFFVFYYQLVNRIYGWGPEALAALSADNPIELLERCDVQPGELAMYIGYVRRDQFNTDAQVESFLYVAHERGLCVDVDYRAQGGAHSMSSTQKFFPKLFDWLAERLAPYSPHTIEGQCAP